MSLTAVSVFVFDCPTDLNDPCSPTSRPLELSAGNGTIASQNYPDDYNDNADCQWRIASLEFNDVSDLNTLLLMLMLLMMLML